MLLPRRIGLPRAALLMQFAVARGYYVDDTPINHMGSVGDVLERYKPPGTVRILIRGGSSLFDRRMAFRHFSDAGTDVFVGHVVAFFDEERLLTAPPAP